MRPLDRVAQVELAADHVLPQRGVGVLVVGEPHLGAGVERVDGHLAIGRPGDLHPAVHQPGRRVGDPPRLVLADVLGLGEEVQRAAGGEIGVAGPRGVEQLAAPAVERAVQRRQQLERLGREHLVVPLVHRPDDLDTGWQD